MWHLHKGMWSLSLFNVMQLRYVGLVSVQGYTAGKGEDRVLNSGPATQNLYSPAFSSGRNISSFFSPLFQASPDHSTVSGCPWGASVYQCPFLTFSAQSEIQALGSCGWEYIPEQPLWRTVWRDKNCKCRAPGQFNGKD